MPGPIWIAERDVVALLSLGESIDALERGLRLEAAGRARRMEKTHVAWGGTHTLHALGASLEGAGLAGTKTWAHTAGGATPLLVLWDSETGALRAVIEAFALGQLRTGAMTGVATRWLASEGADHLAMLGTGKQALAQVAAVALVRKLARISVWSPTLEHRAAFGARLEREGLGCEVAVAESLEEATRGAAIVTTATRAREPFLAARHLEPGAHVNAIGAITPERVELAPDVFPRCAVVVVDAADAARRLSREVIDADGIDLREISAVVASGEHRAPDADLTLFKAMGSGVADLSLAVEIHERAVREGRGRKLPEPARAEPRFRDD